MRLIFMGTPEFALVAVKALAAAGHDLAGVYTQPPRRAGRGKALRPSPVQVWAESRGLPVRTPASFAEQEAVAEFTALKADAAIVAAYGLILPQAVLDTPVHGCLNIHASLLPRWRGAAPIQRAIQAGDAETGITIMQMDAGLDTGPILMQRRFPIADGTTAGGLHDELAALGAEAMAEVLAWLDGTAAGDLAPRLQPGSGATYARKIAKSEARIDWSQPAAHIERTVRAFDPAPGAFFDAGGQRIRVLCAELAEGAGAPGTVLDGNLTVACGEGALRLLRVQRQGKDPMAAADLLRGFAIPAGTILS
ncbi:MAG: methionyl-tRNA formyltransferase [Rhodospirillaceae bacterium]|nr:methionyl-tRNA formyltransferase [Rhodospirillaceae bacterium]MYF85238.1 methionyl-tRNA formyltransferase [Rhodospirillaceae bacterium]MYH37926.1 methionyl-tRNA formyltransferase [Rhodospirillaceae bacterium]MYK15452.1 methionyl-tRNA formyltransferase [Rhodospirillaceae bacterium]MYK57933.1 methionyl-tRNA formyltransferase [Rhodospirillaceae bacterium]